MANQRIHLIFSQAAAVVLSLSVVFGFTSCSEIEDMLESGIREALGEEETRHTRHDEDEDDYTYETLEPTGIYTDETESVRPDTDYINSVYIYSVWYDPVEDNPYLDTGMRSEDSFALKGVFYFSAPLTASFEARLYKDNKVLLTRKVSLKDNVTAEADFSAGLEGFGVFDKGTYKIELVYDSNSIAFTPELEVY